MPASSRHAIKTLMRVRAAIVAVQSEAKTCSLRHSSQSRIEALDVRILDRFARFNEIDDCSRQTRTLFRINTSLSMPALALLLGSRSALCGLWMTLYAETSNWDASG
jgi:hypothetical protein